MYVAGWTNSFGEGSGDLSGSGDIILVKFGAEKREGIQVVPGYDLLLFISIIGVITALFKVINLKKRVE